MFEFGGVLVTELLSWH